jgi:hypothetical protein
MMNRAASFSSFFPPVEMPLPPHPLIPSQADFFHRAVTITRAHKAACEAKGLKKVAEFRESLKDGQPETWPAELVALRKEISAFATQFPAIGFEEAKMR